jgi:hypothetical protein
MPDIYANAYVTTSASRANSCHDGFLSPRSMPKANKLSDYNELGDNLVLHYDHHGVVGPVYLTLKPYDDEYPENDPIETRAWTLQERE